MSQGHQSKSALAAGKTVPISQTAAFIANFAIDNEMRLNLVVDLVLGQVASTPVVKLQDSTGYGLWSDVKSTTLSASTDVSVTGVDTTTGIFTAASHGLSNGQLIAINGAPLPSGLVANQRLYAQSVTTNTFKVSASADASQATIIPATAGTSVTVTAATLATIRVNVNVAGDQAASPMRPMGRLITTTNGSQSVQVLDVRTGYTY